MPASREVQGRDDEAYLQIVTNSRYGDTKVYAVFRDGRRVQIAGVKHAEIRLGIHEVSEGVIRCDLACELTGHKET